MASKNDIYGGTSKEELMDSVFNDFCSGKITGFSDVSIQNFDVVASGNDELSFLSEFFTNSSPIIF